MKLLQNYNKDSHKYTLEYIDRPLESLGLSMKNVHEFHPDNLKAFNTIAGDAESVEYYSVGA
jgi:hypothetical protein